MNMIITLNGGNYLKLKSITPKSAARDIFTGIIIALVSIPISMGYAQVAGIPAVCGLYGSVFPILIFGLFSTSSQFIFGVDAAPAALAGAFLVSNGIAFGSEKAANIIPLMSFFTAIWLFLLFLLRAGKIISYISTPVMGGFISGISTTIIFMQIPKLLGGTSGSGEIVELIKHIMIVCNNSFNGVSALLGAASLVLLLGAKKLMPKLPMSVFVMIGGAVLGYSGFCDKYDIAGLGAVESGLPEWHFPELKGNITTELLTASLTIAVVIMAETLLASSSLASKSGEKLDGNREILVYSLGNLASSLTGCCPVNGSVSRSSMGEQYGGRSQLMSISASVSMIFILLFATGFIKYLPIPVLTAIVISALLGAVEFHLIKRLYKHDRKELFIFFGAFFGVLIFGTIYGVVIGVILSFVSVIIRTANPKRSFLGVIEGHEGFHSLERNSCASPLKNALIYRFSGNLYFANINIFTDDIEAAVTNYTKCVVIDSGAICNIDITAADKIAVLREQLKKQGISLYFASHISSLNDRFRELGLGELIEEGYCRRTIKDALSASGIKPTYELDPKNTVGSGAIGNIRRLEFEWAFGDKADEAMERYTERLISQIENGESPEEKLRSIVKLKGFWSGIGDLDQEELLEHLELHSAELAKRLSIDEERIEEEIELRRLRIAKRLESSDPSLISVVRDHNKKIEERLREKSPDLYNELIEHRREALDHLRQTNPEYIDLIDKFYTAH